ncbi:histidine phosphatase family protein [Microlunatus soli]|uniref:Broad specificity phosphatase PhoE n=1 Tax=Microlunatus soli TaxID=630515 RepID=A0A1H1MXU1_9ACTN|nr:histidine phosphatase family protein [Microlunatus soli]SDR91447.1 Broad specificity phosphatase PhoE [Microlunatus soli]
MRSPVTPRTVILIRHAAPVASGDVAPSEWPLSDAGCRAAEALIGRIPLGAVLASSAERKAVRTLSIAAGVDAAELIIDSRFGEVLRPGEPFDDAVADRRRAWIEGRPDERHLGWESRSEAAARFAAGLEAIDGDQVVVASHGMIITSWLMAIGVVPAASAGDYWAALRFPELIEVPPIDGPLPNRW